MRYTPLVDHLFNELGLSSPEIGNMTYNFAGYGKEDVKVEMKYDVLYITAENEEMGKREHKLLIPYHTDPDKIKVTLKNGLLKVVIPKNDKSLTQISVE